MTCFHCHSSFDRHHYIHSDTKYPEINTKIWKEDKVKVKKKRTKCLILTQHFSSGVAKLLYETKFVKWTLTSSWEDQCKMSWVFGIN